MSFPWFLFDMLRREGDEAARRRRRGGGRENPTPERRPSEARAADRARPLVFSLPRSLKAGVTMADSASERFLAHRCALGSCECRLRGNVCPPDVAACDGCPLHVQARIVRPGVVEELAGPCLRRE